MQERVKVLPTSAKRGIAMPRRNRASGARLGSGKVGYGRPPKGGQFKPGQSGNPKGRPKGTRNFATDLISTLSSPVKVNRGGRVRNVSAQFATLMVLRDKALSGDPRALTHYLNLALSLSTAEPEALVDKLDADEQAILDEYVKRRLAENLSPKLDDSGASTDAKKSNDQ